MRQTLFRMRKGAGRPYPGRKQKTGGEMLRETDFFKLFDEKFIRIYF